MAEELSKDFINKMNILGDQMFNVPQMDTSFIDEKIKSLQTPTGTGVYEKLAAMYRDQNEGATLRTQKDLINLFGPAGTVYRTQKAAADTKFNLLMDSIPEYDDTYIFGEINDTTIPIGDEIKNISNNLKEDYRLISNLNINDPRYDEIKKRIEENEKLIVNYDEVNKKLYSIRNGRDVETGEIIEKIPIEEWSEGMKPEEKRMWQDIYASNGENIKVIKGKLFYVDPENGKQIDLDHIGNMPTEINSTAVNTYINTEGAVDAYILEGGTLDDAFYKQKVAAPIDQLRRLDAAGIKSLIFDGITVGDELGGRDVTSGYAGPNTEEFLREVIFNTYGDLTEPEILEKIYEMKGLDVTDPMAGFKDADGRATTLKALFLNYETKRFRDKIEQGNAQSVYQTENQQNNSSNNRNRNRNTSNTTTTTNNRPDIVNTTYERFGEDLSKIDMLSNYGTFTNYGNVKKDELLFDSEHGTVISALNSEFGVTKEEFGATSVDKQSKGPTMTFHFEYSGSFLGLNEKIVVYYRDVNGYVRKLKNTSTNKDYFEIDNASDDFDRSEENALRNAMKTILKDDLNMIGDLNAENVVEYVPNENLPPQYESVDNLVNKINQNSSVNRVISGGDNQYLGPSGMQ